MPELPWRDTTVTAPCPTCQRPVTADHNRRYCTPACRQAAYRRRHTPSGSPPTTTAPPAAVTRTATGVYQCPGCEERFTGQRRCPDCNLFTRRIGTGGCCPACGDPITIDELLEAATT